MNADERRTRGRVAEQRYRERVRSDPIRYAEYLKDKRRRAKIKYAHDPALRERTKQASKLRYQANREELNAKNRAWYQRNRERYMAYNRARYQTEGPKWNHQARLKRYGLTQLEFEVMQARDPVCAICGGPGNSRGLGIDHDHVTGKVRGLLCPHCNSLLHKLETVPGWVEAAVAYLHR